MLFSRNSVFISPRHREWENRKSCAYRANEREMLCLCGRSRCVCIYKYDELTVLGGLRVCVDCRRRAVVLVSHEANTRPHWLTRYLFSLCLFRFNWKTIGCSRSVCTHFSSDQLRYTSNFIIRSSFATENVNSGLPSIFGSSEFRITRKRRRTQILVHKNQSVKWRTYIFDDLFRFTAIVHICFMRNSLLYSAMHIHPSSPNSSISEEDAATKIQAGFRGYRVRKQLKQNQSSGRNQITNASTYRRSNSIQRSNERKAANGFTLKSKKSVDEEKCATKIQAGVRGFLVRKKQKLATDAAVKIQAGFRGFRARKQLKNLKDWFFVCVKMLPPSPPSPKWWIQHRKTELAVEGGVSRVILRAGHHNDIRKSSSVNIKQWLKCIFIIIGVLVKFSLDILGE